MEDLNDILKLSGMKAKVNEAEVEEAYANEPDEEYQTVDTIIRQGTDLNREKQQHPKGGFTGDNPLAEEESDEDEVRELVLFIDSDAGLYQQQGEPIMRNLSRKWDKGIYDHDLAQKLWYYLAVNGAKKYGQEHGTGNGLKMFSPAVRRAAAKEMADNWMAELKAGNKMDEAEEDLEAMLAEILIGEENDDKKLPPEGSDAPYVDPEFARHMADVEKKQEDVEMEGKKKDHDGDIDSNDYLAARDK